MKKSRLLIALLVMMFAASGYAQDSIRETLKEYYRLSGQGSESLSSLNQLNTYLFDNNGSVDLEQMAKRYVEESLIDRMVDRWVPKFEEINLTEADLKKVNSLLATVAGQNYIAHQHEWNAALNENFSTVMMENLDQIISGDASKPIQPKEGIDAGYIEKFKTSMAPTLVESMTKILDSSGDNMPEFYKTWIIVNLETIALNSAYGILTEEDLDFVKKLNSTDCYSKTKTLLNDLGQLKEVSAGMITNYVKWMQDNGVPLKKGAEDNIKMLFGD